MSKKQHYFVRLLGTRPGWPDDMTPQEETIMGEHFDYLKDLIASKHVVMAGPVLNPSFGLIVLQVDSGDEALKIMENEPSVKKGVHNFEMQPMVMSLLMDHLLPDRHVADCSDRMILKEIVVPAPRASVWRAWTTDEGARSFFASDTRIELSVDGKFEIYFVIAAPAGQRGSEDCRILSFVPEEMLSFEWNAPPQFGALRNQRTRVVITFSDLEDGQTFLVFKHLGWGKGKEWDELYAYFDRAWGYVLANLVKRFREGPLDWTT
jgi:uncharacterized protein YndB with AHSA1/START domain/uncharacterized protein YciI